MGYSYDARTGRLCCDACGDASGTTRKQTCPHRVHYAEGGSLPYCYPSALCKTCYATRKATLHDGCADGAARQTAQQQIRAAKLAAGEYERRTAWGSWHATVPAGLVGVRFVAQDGRQQYWLVPEADYQRAGAGSWMSEYATRTPWEPHA